MRGNVMLKARVVVGAWELQGVAKVTLVLEIPVSPKGSNGKNARFPIPWENISHVCLTNPWREAGQLWRT